MSMEAASIAQHCQTLRLGAIATQFLSLAEEASQQNHSHLHYLEALLQAEVIEKVDAQLKRAAKQRARLFLRQRPGVRAAVGIAVGHASQANARYFHSSSAQSCVVHVLCSSMK